MISLNKFVKKVEENITLSAFILWIITLFYISNYKILELGEKFTIVSGSLLAFVAVFYTVVVVSEFLKKLNELNTSEIKRLKEKVRNLTEEELKNLDSDKFDENSDLCTKKSTFYSELSNIKNRKISRYLFISAFLLIIMLIIDANFIPPTIFDITSYKPLVLVTGFWIVITQILKIVILFYNVYTE